MRRGSSTDDWTEEKAAKTRMRMDGVKTHRNTLKIITDQSHSVSSDDFVLYPLLGQRFAATGCLKVTEKPL